MNDERITAAPQPLRIADRKQAEELAAGVVATIAELVRRLEAETAHVRVGRLREGLAEERRKAELSAAYLQGLEAVKGNAVAIARLAPHALLSLKEAHAKFAGTVADNQMVL